MYFPVRDSHEQQVTASQQVWAQKLLKESTDATDLFPEMDEWPTAVPRDVAEITSAR
jgi:hypothetical protein